MTLINLMFLFLHQISDLRIKLINFHFISLNRISKMCNVVRQLKLIFIPLDFISWYRTIRHFIIKELSSSLLIMNLIEILQCGFLLNYYLIYIINYFPGHVQIINNLFNVILNLSLKITDRQLLLFLILFLFIFILLIICWYFRQLLIQYFDDHIICIFVRILFFVCRSFNFLFWFWALLLWILCVRISLLLLVLLPRLTKPLSHQHLLLLVNGLSQLRY